MSKFLSYLMIAYSFIALILLTNIQEDTSTIENENIEYYNYETSEVNYTPLYMSSTYDEPNGVLGGVLRCANAISEFGQIQLFNTGINTGYQWVDKMLNIIVLPINVIVNMTKLVFKLVYAITGLNFQNGGSAETFDFNWDQVWIPNKDGHGGAFTSGSSYGSGGGSFNGGR